MADVQITMPDGGLAEVPEADLQQALDAGAQLAPQGGPRDEELASPLAKATAFITGADESLGGLGTSLGLAVQELIGGTHSADSAARDVRDVREANPGYVLGGGLVGSLALPGVGIEAGAGSALGRIGARATEGAIEGAISSVGHALTEDALGNPEANAEHYMTGEAATGLLLGAGVGAALGIGGEGLRRFGRGLTGSAAAGGELVEGYRKAEGNIERMMASGKVRADEASSLLSEADRAGRAAGLGDRASERLYKGYTDLFARDNPEMARALRTQFEDGANLIAKTEERLDTRTREVAKALDDAFGAERLIHEQTISGKPAQMARLVDATKSVEAMDAAVGSIRQLREFTGTLRSSSTNMGAGGVMREVEKLTDDFESFLQGGARKVDPKVTAQIERAEGKLAKHDARVASLEDQIRGIEEGASDAAGRKDRLRMLDRTKRQLERAKEGREVARETLDRVNTEHAAALAMAKPGPMPSPAEIMVAYDGLKRSVGKLESQTAGAEGWVRERFRSLYDEALRSPLEDAAVWGEAAAAAQREVNATWTNRLATRDAFERSFSTSFGKEGFQRLERADPAKLKGYLNAVSGSESDLKREALDNYFSGVLSAMDAAEKHYGKQDGYEAGRAAIARARKAFGDATEDAKVIEQLRTQRVAEGDGLGGALGLLSDVVTRPLKTVERLAAIRNGVTRAEKSIKSASDRLFGAGAGKAATTMPRAEVMKRAAAVRELATNPARLQERIAAHTAAIADAAPRHAAAISAFTSRAINHLAQHLPVEQESTSPFAKPRPPSEAEIDSFERRLLAFESPDAVLDRALAGRLSFDTVETMKALRPHQYEAVRAMAAEHFGQLRASGTLDSVPYAKQLQIGILLDIPINETLEPSFIAAIQASKVPAGAPEPPAGRQNSKPARKTEIDRGVMTTESQRLEAGGTP